MDTGASSLMPHGHHMAAVSPSSFLEGKRDLIDKKEHLFIEEQNNFSVKSTNSLALRSHCVV